MCGIIWWVYPIAQLFKVYGPLTLRTLGLVSMHFDKLLPKSGVPAGESAGEEAVHG